MNILYSFLQIIWNNPEGYTTGKYIENPIYSENQDCILNIFSNGECSTYFIVHGNFGPN